MTEYNKVVAEKIPNEAFVFYEITNLNTTDAKEINATIYTTLASDAAIGSFSALMLQSIAREFTGKSDLKIGFTNAPMPPDVLVVNSAQNGFYLSFFGFFFMALDATLILLIKSRIENGFYDTVLMRGSTKFSYWAAHYIKDFCLYEMTIVVYAIGSYFFGIIPDGMI